jgi:AAR2 protein
MADTQQTSYLDMPDDEIGPMPSAQVEDVQTTVAEVVGDTSSVSTQEVVNTDNSEDTSDKTPESTSDEEVTDKDTKDVADTDVSDTTEIDYKAAYSRLTAPFKANGRDITVDNVDDAISLMQMGANYSKKMAGLKPHLKMIKMLEKNGLMDESKLSYLIDLNGRNPDAIAKLLKDSGLDPMEMDVDKAKDYLPTNHQVDDREIELDAVLDDIKDTPTYQRTLSAVSTEWDAASKQVVAASPQILKVINDHMQAGIYDLIRNEVESDKIYGRLQGLSDIEAYRKVGDTIQARGGFDHLAKGRQNQTQQVVVAPKPMQAQDDRLKDKRRAAAPAKAAVTTQVAKVFNPLALSDEEFSKIAKPSYL